MHLRISLFLFLLTTLTLSAQRLEFSWPTPSAGLSPRGSLLDLLQPTASGDPESACFGCVRSNGHQFHEGLDIKPVTRDRRGEASDEVYAAMDGIVRHINSLAGESNYGRYLVLEHPGVSPALCTLYAHLSRISPGLKRGDQVRRGQVLGIMGRSAGGYTIPRERAHLHFEMGVILTSNFQTWYGWKKFGSPNQHGIYNGMNLVGIDPGDFVRKYRTGQVNDLTQYFGQQESAVRIRVATTRTPDFIQRYPSFLAKERPAGLLGGWEVSFNWNGVPFKWVPLEHKDLLGQRQGDIVVVDTNDAILQRHRCKDLIDVKRGRKVPGKELNKILELVFGNR